MAFLETHRVIGTGATDEITENTIFGMGLFSFSKSTVFCYGSSIMFNSYFEIMAFCAFNLYLYGGIQIAGTKRLIGRKLWDEPSIVKGCPFNEECKDDFPLEIHEPLEKF